MANRKMLRLFLNVLAGLVCLLSTIPPVHAGYIKDWVSAHGGCRAGSTLFASIVPGYSFLDRTPNAWGDESLVDEFRYVLKTCASADPVLLTGRIYPTPDQVEAAIDRRVNDLRRILVEPAINTKKIAVAQEEARRRMADDENRRRQEQIAEKIRQDREVAKDAASRAAEEGPAIAELEQKAAEAHRARIEAERLRDENRKRLDALEQSAKVDAAAAKRAIEQESADTRSATDRTDRVSAGQALQGIYGPIQKGADRLLTDRGGTVIRMSRQGSL